MKNKRRCLLLTQSYEPLAFITDIDAIVLVFKGKVDVLDIWDEKICSPTSSFDIPATVILRNRVKRAIKKPRFSRRVLFNRDGWKCAYCRRTVTAADASIDHVVPKCQGGKTTWMNCVTSCKPCNKRKADMTLTEACMTLHTLPKIPSPYHIWGLFGATIKHPGWEDHIVEKEKASDE